MSLQAVNGASDQLVVIDRLEHSYVSAGDGLECLRATCFSNVLIGAFRKLLSDPLSYGFPDRGHPCFWNVLIIMSAFKILPTGEGAIYLKC